MSKLRLNVGSGQRPFALPWVNIDCQSKYNPDIVADASGMPMFEDGSADIVVLHHVLEHFGCGESAGLITECKRILAPGGSLIVCVPDFRSLVRGWITGQIDDQIFFTNVYGAYLGDEADRHKWGFTRESLIAFLSKMGWTDVKLFDFRKIEGADIANAWWILGCEAIK